jgi:uncharacterized membrane protein (DUF485 family)
VLSTLSYGHSGAARAFRWSRGLSRIGCWSIIVFEMSFSLVLLAGHRGLLGVLALGAAFHLACAVLMGLNCFLWSFVATYPAVIFTWALVRHSFL